MPKIESAARFIQRFFYTFLDISGIMLGVFLICLGGWAVTGHPISHATGMIVLALGICAFMIHCGHYFHFRFTRWIFGSEGYFHRDDATQQWRQQMTDPTNRIDTRESGLPGGGTGRKDEVGISGIYPASGPFPNGPAELRGQASWGQGERGSPGYEEHGGEELNSTERRPLRGHARDNLLQTLNLQIPANDVILAGELNLPAELRGIVLFAHGSGSSRHSPRNQYVARVLQDAGIATLLFDLLTEEEETVDRETGHLRFNIGLLAQRLGQATAWVEQLPQIEEVKVGYFGASTGAAAALVAAAKTPEDVSAVVSRGGRPDLAGSSLGGVQAPTLLIVGAEDTTVLKLNQSALENLSAEKRLQIIPGATHLFEEAGALEEVARLARQWFEWHLGWRENRVQAA